jgi:starvation-inducible outer membrane lipoprotein
MKKQLLVILTCIALGLAGCSDSKDESKNAKSQTQEPAPSTAQATSPSGPPTNGKVVKAMHAGGYTYMQVESQGKQFWVASTMMNVKRNDHVAWSGAAVMKNFNSPTLHRTFEEILFVSTAKVE